jgi:hypothetical protein
MSRTGGVPVTPMRRKRSFQSTDPVQPSFVTREIHATHNLIEKILRIGVHQLSLGLLKSNYDCLFIAYNTGDSHYIL